MTRILLRGLVVARSVGRVVIRQRGRVAGYGTGFLVAPGVLMTNEHVLTTEGEVSESWVEFDYERDLDGNERRPKRFALLSQPAPIIVNELDFTLCAVSAVAETGQRLSDFFQTGDPAFPAIAAHRRALDGQSVQYEQDWLGRSFDVHVEPMLDEQAQVIGCVGVIART